LDSGGHISRGEEAAGGDLSKSMEEEATDPADLEAQARAELGFSRRLEQPRRISLYPGLGGSGGYAVWYCEQQLQRFNASKGIDISLASIY
jgi:hypothetical protein